MDAKAQVLPLVRTATTSATDSAEAFQRRINELATLARTIAELKAAANDPSGLPVIPLTVIATTGATVYVALARVAAVQALAPFL